MVMDATQPQQPSPQSVGREFVRQYYTLLNKAPNHLHRFYNNNSSFIHGESTLVVGQKNIHNRIQQLNFHDCHAKISQVDAQATLGNGVVVQVTGELSNDGQPMRRFTQTFVLAAQSPKKYYVHNDIFRYQDLYSDEENDNELRPENDEDHELQTQSSVLAAANASTEPPPPQVTVGNIVSEQQQPPQQSSLSAQVVSATSGSVLPQHPQQVGPQPAAPQQQHQQQQQPTIFYSMSAGARPVPVLAGPQGNAVQQLGGPFATNSGAIPTVAPQVAPPAANVSQLNGVNAHDDLISGGMQPQQQQAHVVTSNSSNIQQLSNVPVTGTTVLATQATPSGVATVPLANVSGIGQATGAAAGIPGFQQSPLLQQQHQMQQLPGSHPNSQTLLQQQQAPPLSATNVNEIEDTLSLGNNSINEVHVTETSPAPPVVDDFKTINEQQQQEKYEAAKQQQQQQSEPKTYANLFKSTSPSRFVNSVMQSQTQQVQQNQPSGVTMYQSNSAVSTSTFTQSDINSAPSSMSVYSNQRDSGSMRMDNNLNSSNVQSGPMPQRNNSRINKDYDQRRTSNAQQFGDNQQLFLGNIPHHASEDELKTLFSRFGTVLELRILSKQSGKVAPGVRNPLNYGFLTYDDSESVQQCLSACPLYFPENSPDGQKLNIEEKKPRMRSDMPQRQSGIGMNSNMNNSQRNNMNSGGPSSRSLSNSGGMMRNNNNSNMSRGGTSGGGGGGQRLGGGFNRNDNRGSSNGGGPSVRSGQNNNAQSGGGNYANRR